jgi:4'-phosphopantetheinyl transferase EntD
MNVNGVNVTASALLAGLFPPGIVAFECHAPFAPAPLHPAEAQCVARAVPKRLGEFAAGRACAHAALAQLQIADYPLRMGAEREPLWPAGIVGSITHSGSFCGAALARSAEIMGLGVDVEQRSAVRPELWRAVSTAQELEWLHRLPEAQARTMAAVVFSAKEAFFKCQFPLTRQWLGFAHVAIHVEADRFAVRPCRTLQLEELAPPPWGGCFALQGALVATGVALERQGRASTHRADPAIRGTNRTVHGTPVDDPTDVT